MGIGGRPGAPCITDKPQDGSFFLYCPLPREVDVIDAPDKAFDAGRRRGAANKLQKCLSGSSPFSDEVLQC